MKYCLGFKGFSDSSVVKNMPVNSGDTDWVPGCKDPLEKETATYTSILVWEIPLTEELDRLLSMESQRVRHGLATKNKNNFAYDRLFF